MDHSIIGLILAASTPLVVFAFGYGSVTARVAALESVTKNSVSKAEFRSLEHRIEDLTSEIKDLRGEIMSILKSQSTGRLQ